MEQLGSYWTYFREILYEDFSKNCREIQVSLKSDKGNGYFTWRLMYLFIISRLCILRMANVSEKICRENQKAFCVQYFFFFENRAVYEKMWKKYCRAGQATNDHVACGHCKYTQWRVILIAFPQQRWLHEHALVLRYTYIASRVIFCKYLNEFQ